MIGIRSERARDFIRARYFIRNCTRADLWLTKAFYHCSVIDGLLAEYGYKVFVVTRECETGQGESG
jgi:hypothetical protein